MLPAFETHCSHERASCLVVAILILTAESGDLTAASRVKHTKHQKSGQNCLNHKQTTRDNLPIVQCAGLSYCPTINTGWQIDTLLEGKKTCLQDCSN